MNLLWKSSDYVKTFQNYFFLSQLLPHSLVKVKDTFNSLTGQMAMLLHLYLRLSSCASFPLK